MLTSPPTYRFTSPAETAAGAVVGAAAGAVVGAAAGLAAGAAVGGAAAAGALVGAGAVALGAPQAARRAVVPTANEPWTARARNRRRLVSFNSIGNTAFKESESVAPQNAR